MTSLVRTLGKLHRHLPVSQVHAAPVAGSAWIAAYDTLHEVLDGFGIGVTDVPDAARPPADIFDDVDNQIACADVGRLRAVSVQFTNCNPIGMLSGRRASLAAVGLVGRSARQSAG
ncbi:MAG: hypothetical protein OEY13_10680 [Gammaproteobacteria bacterium]|nr:hypothetical protein [Gammaproteobacteria bacterium]